MREALAEAVTAAIRAALPAGVAGAALHEPRFAGREWEYLKDCLDSGWVSSVGAYVDRFERDLAAYTGAAHAVAVVNGTAALHVALLLAGVERGDEVLVPALTFVATANAVAYLGAVPHFVDSEPSTLGIDPAALECYLAEVATVSGGVCRNRRTGRRIRAVVPMHVLGHPVALEGLLALSGRFGLAVVEDAAEALGTTYRDRHAGTWGRLGILSFNGNKILTTGGGGALLTDDPQLAREARHLTTTAKLPHAWAFVHDAVGYNYRLPNLNAALGVAQLEQLPAFLAHKRALAARYAAAFAGLAGASVVSEPEGARSNYWLNAILLDRPADRDAVLAATNAAGLMTRPAWALLNTLPMYADCPAMALGVAEDLASRLVCLPSSAHLGASHAA